jgi:hypothetical protein
MRERDSICILMAIPGYMRYGVIQRPLTVGIVGNYFSIVFQSSLPASLWVNVVLRMWNMPFRGRIILFH